MTYLPFKLVFDIQLLLPSKYIIFAFNKLMSLKKSITKALIICLEDLERIKELFHHAIINIKHSLRKKC